MGFLDIFRRKTPDVNHYIEPDLIDAEPHVLREVTADEKTTNRLYRKNRL